MRARVWWDKGWQVWQWELVDLPTMPPDPAVFRLGPGASYGWCRTWPEALQVALDRLWLASLACRAAELPPGAHGPAWRPWRRRRAPGPRRPCR